MSDAVHSTLVVLADGEHVGSLTQDRDGRLEFTYDESWRAREQRTPLSLSMPLASAAHGDQVVRAFLWGLLPDNERVLEQWARDFHVSARNPFALLRHVGQDCAGAVQFVPPDDADKLSTGEGGVAWLDEDEVAGRLALLRRDPTAWHATSNGRFSLAGAQAKMALHHDPDTGRWGDPWGAVPTTHILKPAVTGLDDHDLNEHLCLQAARLLGLVAAPSRVVSFDGERAIVVDRYDRIVVADGRIRRVHQEDLCQALGVPPSARYESEGGPGAEAVIGLLRRTVQPFTAAVDSVRRFVDALAFNWIALGTDAHAKNYSVLLAGSAVRLAPLYDIASAAPYDDMPVQKLRTAMRIGGEYRFLQVQARHWRRLAQAAELDADAVVARVVELAANLPDALAAVSRTEAVRAVESDLPARLVDRLAAWTARCRNVLTSEDD